MLSKVDIIKEKILNDIGLQRLKPGDLLPSRHSIMRKYGFARATVDTAIKDLVLQNYLYSVQGSGTFVAKLERPESVRKAYIIDDYRSTPYTEHGILSIRIAAGIQEYRECQIVHPNQVKLYMKEIMEPGNAVIWVRPNAIHLSVINYLKNAAIPQLLIGRSYLEFNYISTDAETGISQGFEWFRERGVDEVALITHENNPMLPYIAERQIAFYRSCAECGINVNPDILFRVKQDNLALQLNDIAKKLFGGEYCPKGIFITRNDMLLSLLSLAESFSKRPGRDFYLLSFDDEPSLTGTEGICMLRQRWGQMGRLAIKWFLNDANKNKQVKINVEPKLIIGG